MFKAGAIGFIIGIIICAILWFSMGRNNLGEIKDNFNRLNKDYKTIQSAVNQLRTNSTGFAENISSINNGSKRIADRGTTLEKRLTVVDGQIRSASGKVDKVEQWNSKLIRLNGELQTVAHNVRELSKASGE